MCDLDEVPDFNQMYGECLKHPSLGSSSLSELQEPRLTEHLSSSELYDPMTIMFFYRNKHMMCDFGTGNNNKLNWVLEDKQELIDIIETIYRGAKKGRGLVVSPKDYSTRYRY